MLVGGRVGGSRLPILDQMIGDSLAVGGISKLPIYITRLSVYGASITDTWFIVLLKESDRHLPRTSDSFLYHVYKVDGVKI